MVRGLVNLKQFHVLAADDRDDDALGALHRDTVEQRVGNRLFRRFECAVFAATFAGTHHRLAHFGHDRANVGKVEVDKAGHDHQVGDRTHALLQHLVGQLEGFLKGRFGLGDQEQVLVWNDDQGIYVLLQLLDPRLGGAHPARALEQERLGYHADSQHALVTRGLCHHRRGAGAGAPAHAGGDEAHVHAIERALDLGHGFLCRRAPDFGPRSGAQALGDIGAELDAVFGDRVVERLRIGVGDHKVHAFDPGGDHVGDRVAAGTAHPDNRDAGAQLFDSWRSDVDAHGALLSVARMLQLQFMAFLHPSNRRIKAVSPLCPQPPGKKACGRII